jgi:hypothetical protein
MGRITITMTQIKRYESADRLESQQIRQADKLSQGWTLWNSTDPIAVLTRLLLVASTVGTAASFLQSIGSPILGWMVFGFIATGGLLYFCWQYRDNWHRISFAGLVWVGFVFAMDWRFLLTAVEHLSRATR